ncbi:unnamed protein product [Clonostachys byssicola]|uniref:Isochorismatase-like domain-containing protein n=1 Tax=Clonostachys byssicola TaxID=160290 RepID=A0A9N9UFJ9_9HYPO|nr:unnamed protein product [Clonostachys byssicola]
MRGTYDKIKLDLDLQVGFMGEGPLLEVPNARGIVDNVNRVSQALRSVGATIAYVQYKLDADEPHRWGSHYDSMTPDAAKRIRTAFSVGKDQHAFCPGLDVQPEDIIVPKRRWSAFILGTCDLDALLKAKCIDTLIITGTTINIRCESTIRDAMQMGYNVLFEQDGNATRDNAVHNANLLNMLSSEHAFPWRCCPR